MSGRWDDEKHEDNNSGGWSPRHYGPQPQDDNNKKIYSVSEASRLHEDEKTKDISVKGVISGIQPLRKMINGKSCQCMKCNTPYEIKYEKPELFESYVPIENIRKCPKCKSGDYLGRFKYEHINAVVVELKDSDTFSEIDPLRIIIFGDEEPAYDNTRNIDRHIGETIIVRGDIYNVDIGKRRESKVVSYLYVKYLVEFLSKQDIELTSEDAKAVKRFVKYIGQDKIVDKLCDMFATSIFANNYVKKGFLLIAASTSLSKTAKKLHLLLVGDPGLAKSELLKKATELVPNSRYESVQFATGKSLTAIVSKEEGDALILRIGPVAQAKGAIVGLNEITGMSAEDQRLMLDTMQEQEFTTNKFGQNFYVDAPTAIIASANPIGGSWKAFDNEDTNIDLDKIPTIKPLIDRFDFIFTFKDNRNEDFLSEYAHKKSEIQNRSAPDYTQYLIKHIMYAKQYYPKPQFSEEATAMLNQYYVKVRQKFGSPRILNTIFETARSIARLKLKNVVDANDAKETMQFYNYILLQLDKIVELPSNPRDLAYQECLDILKRSDTGIAFEELIHIACKRNKQVERYIGKSFRLEDNKKLRAILDMIRNHSHVNEIQMRPVALQYMHVHSDLNDPNDLSPDTQTKKLEQGIISDISNTRSERSERSDTYAPMYTLGNGNGGNGEGLLKCYWCEKEGSLFKFNSELEYLKHGDRKHPNKPMFPNIACIVKNGLKAQGKEWEV
jgi:DNA replicative helicase MCM subunit Mcm2 (Cdc46/Mcm family)